MDVWTLRLPAVFIFGEDQEVGGELGRKVGHYVYETLSQGR